MKIWRMKMILLDTESQINYVATIIKELHKSDLKESQIKELKALLSNNELTLAKVWEELERIIEE